MSGRQRDREAATSPTEQPERNLHRVTSESELPLVLFEQDICDLFGFCTRTLHRQLRAGVFPIPEMPKMTAQHRWSRADVLAFLANPRELRRARRAG